MGLTKLCDLLLLLGVCEAALHDDQWGHQGGLLVREERGRIKREVGPVMGRKYRRLDHSIIVQTEIRSRY